MEKNGWKTLAFIFITLFCIETILIIWIGAYGVNEINKEVDCSLHCNNLPECVSFHYDDLTSTCLSYGMDEGEFVLIASKRME